MVSDLLFPLPSIALVCHGLRALAVRVGPPQVVLKVGLLGVGAPVTGVRRTNRRGVSDRPSRPAKRRGCERLKPRKRTDHLPLRNPRNARQRPCNIMQRAVKGEETLQRSKPLYV